MSPRANLAENIVVSVLDGAKRVVHEEAKGQFLILLHKKASLNVGVVGYVHFFLELAIISCWN